MNLGNVSAASLHSDKAYSQRAAKDYLDFIIDNLSQLDNIRNGAKYKEDARQLSKQEYPYTSPQLSYIDAIYEKVMKGFGLPSFSPTFKPKRRCV